MNAYLVTGILALAFICTCSHGYAVKEQEKEEQEKESVKAEALASEKMYNMIKNMLGEAQVDSEMEK